MNLTIEQSEIEAAIRSHLQKLVNEGIGYETKKALEKAIADAVTPETNTEQARSSAAPCSGGKLTMEALMAAMAKLPPPPKWRACVMKPERLARLRSQTRRTQTLTTFDHFMGLPFYEKVGQVADAWMFADEDILRKYLNGSLSELDLIAMIASGACLPNDQSSATRGGDR